jgi:hypothetical protein
MKKSNALIKVNSDRCTEPFPSLVRRAYMMPLQARSSRLRDEPRQPLPGGWRRPAATCAREAGAVGCDRAAGFTFN